MCGIAGIWDFRCRSPGELESQIQRMTATLAHRGPDDLGHWVSPHNGLALGHRRLSIIDLSPAGHQPMASPCGRLHVVYNGELYNYRELRSELERAGETFRGQSDTEVLAAGCSQWGVSETARRAVGMWAAAVWDEPQRRLTLLRDRMGIKPLYYGLSDGCLLFASELKAIRQHPAFRPQISRAAIAEFLRYGYIPAPATIYDHIHKLPPGTVLELEPPAWDGPCGLPPPSPYWSLDRQVCQRRLDPGSDTAAPLAQFKSLLLEAVSLRMIADVPLGAFLSGGIDSSLVVAAMQQLSSTPVKTFCIGFEELGYDEAPYARAVAKHLGTEHHELYVTASQARDVIPQLPQIYDEPFADSSQIPTLLVSRLAREHVTVSLSGDGGDELFCGYDRYTTFAARWRKLVALPRPLRRLAAGGLRIASRATPAWLGDKLRRRAAGVDVHSPSELYAVHNAHWKDAHRVVLGDSDELRCKWREPPCRVPPEEAWMAADAAAYLPDDILVKVDRASMSVGLEARVPLLDHRLVEFAWTLPLQWKLRDGQSKWLLREALSEFVPRQLFQRPKMGFGVPIGSWLRGPLRDWADDLLSPDRLQRQGLLDARRIADVWSRHRSGSQNWEYLLWDVLMLQSWLDHTASPTASEA